MGGPGSGRNSWGIKKTIVEECLSLDANHWLRLGGLKNRVRYTGSWHWTYAIGGAFKVDYEVNTLDPSHSFVRLFYSWVWISRNEPDSADYRVGLTTTRPPFGGLRWWFLCPLGVNGRACNRRVGKLYLPQHARFFGCRRCHALTYRSAQEHDNRVSRLRMKRRA